MDDGVFIPTPSVKRPRLGRVYDRSTPRRNQGSSYIVVFDDDLVLWLRDRCADLRKCFDAVSCCRVRFPITDS